MTTTIVRDGHSSAFSAKRWTASFCYLYFVFLVEPFICVITSIITTMEEIEAFAGIRSRAQRRSKFAAATKVRYGCSAAGTQEKNESNCSVVLKFERLKVALMLLLQWQRVWSMGVSD